MAQEQPRKSVIEFPHARATVGGRLCAAREAAGLTLEQVAAETKIPMRMLASIEADNYAALPAKAYATGFTRTYAKALGLNGEALVAEVRKELDQADQAEQRGAAQFEPGDPARVPTARLAWAAAVVALIVLVVGLMLWQTHYAPAVTLPPLPQPSPPAASAASPPAPALQLRGIPAEGAPAQVAGPAPAGAASGAAAGRPAPARPGPARPSHSSAAQGPAAGSPADPAQPTAAAILPSPASTAQF